MRPGAAKHCRERVWGGQEGLLLPSPQLDKVDRRGTEGETEAQASTLLASGGSRGPGELWWGHKKWVGLPGPCVGQRGADSQGFLGLRAGI